MADKLPPGTTELHALLGVNEPDTHGDHHTPVDLPLVKEAEKVNPESPEEIIEHNAETNTYTLNLSRMKPTQIAKKLLPYIAVFVIAILAYIALFTNFSFSSVIDSFTKTPASQQTASAQGIPQSQLDAYNAWIRSYFFDVNDPKILDPNADISGNGLTNYQKFLLGLNPKKQDTLGLGRTDTQDLLMGIDPLTGQPLTESQKEAIAQAIDLESLSNKLSSVAAQNSAQIAGAYTAGAQITLDQNKPAQIDIPSLKISAPLIWSQNVDAIDNDLERGVVHYPGTPMPGEIGTSYISGHSSNYVWAKGNYNKIFATLGNLKKGAQVNVTATDINGKKIIFHYSVATSGIFKADDQQQFANIGKSSIALSTCWPIGTNQKRLVVFAYLDQIEQ